MPGPGQFNKESIPIEKNQLAKEGEVSDKEFENLINKYTSDLLDEKGKLKTVYKSTIIDALMTLSNLIGEDMNRSKKFEIFKNLIIKDQPRILKIYEDKLLELDN